MENRIYVYWNYRTNPNGSKLWRIIRLEDRNGNALSYTYPNTWQPNPTRIEDGLGRFIEMTYEQLEVGGDTVLTRVDDFQGRRITFTYEPSGADNADALTLRSITGPSGNTLTLSYAGSVLSYNNLVTGQTLPEGNTPYTQVYQGKSLFLSGFPRVVSQRDVDGNESTINYDGSSNTVTATRPDASETVYRHYSLRGFPEQMTDAQGNAIAYTKSDEEQLTSITDRLGDTTSFTYHAETGKRTSITNAKGDTTSFTYTARQQTYTNPENGEKVPPDIL